MKKIRILQIGVGHDHARETYYAMRELSSYYEIVGVCDKDIEKAKARIPDAEAYYSVKEALKLDNIDAVAIECEEEDAAYYADLFAKKGIAVHLDKPGAITLEQFETLTHTVKENNTVFHMGYMYRSNPMIKKVLSDIKEGKLGQIISVEGQMNIRHNDEKRLWLKKFGGGMMFYLGCHLIDLVFSIQGMPTDVTSFLCESKIGGVKSKDVCLAVMKYNNGVSYVKTSSCEYNGYCRRQLVITGSNGTVEINPLEICLENGLQTTKCKTTLASDEPNILEDSGKAEYAEKHQRYAVMMEDFAKYVLKTEENPYSPDYELELFKVLLMCCGEKV